MSDKKSNYKKITIIAVIILALVCVVGTVIFVNSRETTEVAEQMEENTQQAALEDEANASSNEGENTQSNTEQSSTNNNEQQASVTTDNNSVVETFTTTTTESTNDATTAVTQTIETVDTEDVELDWYQMERPEVEEFDITVKKPNLQINLEATKDVVDVNEKVEYKITIANQGNVDANKIIVSNIIPEGTTFDSASDDGKYNEETKQIVWKVDVKQNETKTLTATVVTGNEQGVIEDKAVVDGETTNAVEVTVQDMTAPKIQLNGDKNITLEAGVDKYTEYGARVTDNVDPTIENLQPSAIHFEAKDGTKANVDKVDETKLGLYKVVYEYTDAAGNKAVDIDREDHDYVIRLVTVQDMTAPKIKLNGDKEITLEAGVDKYTEYGATVTDNVDATIEDLQPSAIHFVAKDGTKANVDKVDETKLGLYKVVYEYTDAAGNKAVDIDREDHDYVIRLVTVQDTIAPVATNLEIMNINQVTPGFAKVGDRIRVLVTFEEKLGTNPVICINGVNAENVHIHDSDEARNMYQYMGEVVMTNTMEEGLITFTVSGYTDLAGNEGVVLTNENINSGETREIVLDKTAPEIKQLSMANEQNVTLGYAKAGDSIWVYALFNEKLSVEPEVTINGVPATKKYDYVDDTQQQYVGAVTMTTEMKEGEIEFTVKGYKDLAGNEGKDLTQKDITEGNGIILDYTAPRITSPRYPELKVFDENPYKVVITNRDGETTAKADKEGRTTYWVRLEDGSYTVTATDAAGNVTKRALIKYSGKYFLISDVEDSTLIYPIPEGTNNSTEMTMADEVSSNLPEDVQVAVESGVANVHETALDTNPDEMTPSVTEQNEDAAEESSEEVTSEEENSAEEQISDIEENDN